jgi:site-specific DNA recombinase
MIRAVIYTRVSSRRQVSNVSLDLQERTCREYCAANGYDVERIYREEGESAKTSERTELMQMLADLRKRPGFIEVVVVYDTSRFARNAFDHASLKKLLLAAGAKLRAATQPIEDSTPGRAIEGIFAVFNQLDNELRSDKVVAGMKETAARGLWPWAAPLGYRNARSADGRKIVSIDPEAGTLLQRGFELAASGVAPAEILQKLTALGLRSRKGGQLRYADMARVLRNPFYRGLVRSMHWAIEVPGQHPALIDDRTWHRVQAQLGGRSTEQPPRRSENPDFPLRGFVRCAHCGTVLTASWSTGKQGKSYAYYRCWARKCGVTINVPAPRLERQFGDLLKSVELDPAMARLVEASLQEVWAELRKTSERDSAGTRRRIADLERRKHRLVEAYIYQQAIDRATYDRELAGIEDATTLANLELHETAVDDLDLDGALGFARHVLTRTCKLWQEANSSQKRRLQALIFPKGVTFDGNRLGTPEIASIFNWLRPSLVGEVKMVEQKGLEPSTPTLRTWCSPS